MTHDTEHRLQVLETGAGEAGLPLRLRGYTCTLNVYWPDDPKPGPQFTCYDPDGRPADLSLADARAVWNAREPYSGGPVAIVDWGDEP